MSDGRRSGCREAARRGQTTRASSVSARFFTLSHRRRYISVTIASTTDEMLVRSSPVTLAALERARSRSEAAFGFYDRPLAAGAPPRGPAAPALDARGEARALRAPGRRSAGGSADAPDRSARELLLRPVLDRGGSSRSLHALSGLIMWLTAVVAAAHAAASGRRSASSPTTAVGATWLHRPGGRHRRALTSSLWPQLSPGTASGSATRLASPAVASRSP